MNLDAAVEALEALARGATARGQVSCAVDDRIAALRWSNPAARNAFDVGMMAALAGHVRVLVGRDDIVGVVVCADPAGGAFCAGGDLDDVVQGLWSPSAGRTMAAAMRTVTDALGGLPAVVRVEVDGAAVGGGAELCTIGDSLVMTDGAWLAFRQVTLGVACGWGGAPRLARRVGAACATRWLTTGGRVDAASARRAGLADAEPVSRDAWATSLRASPPRAVQAVMRQVRAAQAGHAAGVQDEVFAGVWGGEDHGAALRAAGVFERLRGD